jgi:hypothetical protein
LSILPLLDTPDLILAAAALASNGDEVNRKVLYAAVYMREGDAGLKALAEQLRRDGRPDLAAETEEARAGRQNRDGGG